ncbi:hypothetical protein LBBP_03667 [Leptospira borgpetersenii serovar Ballum]|uniref:Uncharacterized protein n=1 Tax=Leptospira borgpetersenii serovar Ballum TaxID=280505 RepID=A0A0S2IW22_LEPBO|nr:hypothetical protein LBBP_03667 [Leptospira borgpetersenii serovar Ballum]
MNRSDRRKKNTKKVHGKQKEKTLNLYLSPDEFRLNTSFSGLCVYSVFISLLYAK